MRFARMLQIPVINRMHHSKLSHTPFISLHIDMPGSPQLLVGVGFVAFSIVHVRFHRILNSRLVSFWTNLHKPCNFRTVLLVFHVFAFFAFIAPLFSRSFSIFFIFAIVSFYFFHFRFRFDFPVFHWRFAYFPLFAHSLAFCLVAIFIGLCQFFVICCDFPPFLNIGVFLCDFCQFLR